MNFRIRGIRECAGVRIFKRDLFLIIKECQMKRICLGVLLLSVGGSTFSHAYDILAAITEGRALGCAEQDVLPSVLAGLRIMVEEEGPQHPVPTPNASPNFHPISPPTSGLTTPEDRWDAHHPVSPPCKVRSPYRVYCSRTRSGSNSGCFFNS
jgi:hypothetical protein